MNYYVVYNCACTNFINSVVKVCFWFFLYFSGAKWKNTWEPAESFISYKDGKNEETDKQN